jgi:hypothetical protein
MPDLNCMHFNSHPNWFLMQDSWEFYRRCEHATALYLRSFKPKAGGCASVQAKGPCSTILPTSKNSTG